MISDPLYRALALWGVATAIVTAASVLWIDIPVANFFYAQRESAWVAFFAAITDFANGVVKAAAFGLAISLVSCHFGLAVRGGALGVGRAVNSSVVASAISIFVLDYFITWILK